MITHTTQNRASLTAFCFSVLALVSQSACSDPTVQVQVAKQGSSRLVVTQLPPSTRFSEQMSYFRTDLSSDALAELKSALATNNVRQVRQEVDYYLNYEQKETISLVVHGDTLSPSLYFHEDLAVESGVERLFFAFNTPFDSSKELIVESALLDAPATFKF